MLVSAAMIVRDEEKRLDACLTSIQELVDEIVVVDTGSVDRTPEIAKAHGAQLHFQEWQSDFSFHRNYSIDLTSGDWVFIIDGDEELIGAQDLRAVIESSHGEKEIDSASVWVRGVTEAGPCEQYRAIRAFRRGKARFEQPVHNQLTGVTAPASSEALLIAHYEHKLEEKAERSIPLLMSMLEQDPESPHATFFLCKTYWALGQLDHCLHWAKRCRELVPEHPGYASLWIWLYYSTLALEGPDAAEAVLHEGLKHHPSFPELRHCAISMALFRWNQVAGSNGPYTFAAQKNFAFLKNLPQAATLLGLPLDFRSSEVSHEIDKAWRGQRIT